MSCELYVELQITVNTNMVLQELTYNLCHGASQSHSLGTVQCTGTYVSQKGSKEITLHVRT